MTTTTDMPPASASSSGMSPDEKKAAVGLTFGAFLLGTPVAGVIMALAIGIEQAFSKAGWEKPSWSAGSGPAMSAEELEERRQRLVAEAAEQLHRAQQRAAARAKLRREHHERMREWFEGGKETDKPGVPDGMHRNPWEFLKDFLATSKSRYRLFDDKMVKGNEKITGTYPAISAFFQDLWKFGTGFIEGTRAGWQQYQEQKKRGEPCPVCGEANNSFDPVCYRCRDNEHSKPDYAWGKSEDATVDQPTPDPATALPPDSHPAVDPAPDSPDEPAAGSAPAAGPEPGPLTGSAPPPIGGSGAGQSPTEPAGSREGTVEGDVLDTDGTTVLPAGGGEIPAHRGPQGTTNLDLILQAFQPIPALLASADRQLPDLRQMQAAIAARVRWITSLCAVHGAPAEVYAVLNHANQVAGALGTGLETIQLDNASARELAAEAMAGLQPAQGDLQTVHAQGASGDLLNRPTA